MMSFYEFHDSILKEVTVEQDRLTLRLRATRIDWPTAEMDADGDDFTQEIQFDFEGVKVSKDAASYPVYLLDGSFRADRHDGDFTDPNDYVIPASLRTADGVHIVMAGTDEANENYITLEIQASSMRLTALNSPKFLRKIPART
jgi:hypothetical protein